MPDRKARSEALDPCFSDNNLSYLKTCRVELRISGRTIMEAVTTTLATMKFAAAKFSAIKGFSVLSFIAGALITFVGTILAGSGASQHVYELRLYHVNEGKMEALISRFGEHTDAIF